ncbi:MAG: hypothetical protein ACXVCY_12740 [Pseudobdellovibrionaceae bacterium]
MSTVKMFNRLNIEIKSKWMVCFFLLLFILPYYVKAEDPLKVTSCPVDTSQLKSVQQESAFDGSKIWLAPEAIKKNFIAVFDQLLSMADRTKNTELHLLIQEMRSKIGNVIFCINGTRGAFVGSSTRTGSVYFKDKNLIIFNLSLLERLKNQPGRGLGMMALHELIGALGYSEQNFAISSVLYLNIHSEVIGQENVERLNRNFGHYLKKHTETQKHEGNVLILADGGGGGSGGPSGGDPYVAELKSLLLRVILTSGMRSQLLDQAIMDALELDIEPAALIPEAVRFYLQGSSDLFYAISQNKIIIAVDTEHFSQLLDDRNPSNVVKLSILTAKLFNLMQTLNGHNDVQFSIPGDGGNE